MPDRIPVYARVPATVHCWSEDVPSRTFVSLERALAYCRKNISELPAIELFVHCGQIPEPIISGEELAALIKTRRRNLI
ncbi:hypothetical protein [Neorhizobium galegae]|uniref:hypothetical protein n=1 Tax=Neorhizobium galegae TaxID=399 RepID=UPI00062241B8|nr:hypothetical protein [Neorhizobium galegae]KAB1121984.1 hypothetical protein F4V90_22575 [Neorhizobium galegae]MCQ1809429.1 hypothetical protein [Neorhizobium galegae]CDZ63642.1 Hypothetical protein NGAL_HAMBI2566_56640 [Neorhizobium galegae bv. orientalis]